MNGKETTDRRSGVAVFNRPASEVTQYDLPAVETHSVPEKGWTVTTVTGMNPEDLRTVAMPDLRVAPGVTCWPDTVNQRLVEGTLRVDTLMDALQALTWRVADLERQNAQLKANNPAGGWLLDEAGNVRPEKADSF